MLFLHVLVACLLQNTVSEVRVRASRGCTTVTPLPGEHLEEHKMVIHDFETVSRSFWMQTSARPAHAALDDDLPVALLFSFHGQTQHAHEFGKSHKFAKMSKERRLIVVYPQGLDDSRPDEDQGTGWNVGGAEDRLDETCLPDGVGSNYGCYKSCDKQDLCGNCNWSTCYNDVLFFKKMLAWLTDNYCIDENSIYAHGESNGAMFLHHLVRQLPDVFAAVVPWYGTPMLGYLLGEHSRVVSNITALQQTALLTLHARQDDTIPPDGGVSKDGWIYESESSVRHLWAAIHTAVTCGSCSTPLRGCFRIKKSYHVQDVHVVCT
eukprot:TRINITY_DN33938_c0_g1_i1.p1 TRINITY_DN33938_c0_g1~~TRINITY_DN33938_c0_g1_i1.p1  ORF type:complete len:321 (+),score=33.49 TRINITY_DN33938_c0_g1_i1:77-1039(+)